jgi:ABC-type Fe3+-siderophore transport system permease subunit
MMTDAVVSSNAVRHDARMRRLLVALLVGGAVPLALGVYGNVHDPTGEQPYTLGFSGVIQLKVWFATGVVVLAAVQVLLGARLYGKLTWPGEVPGWLTSSVWFFSSRPPGLPLF